MRRKVFVAACTALLLLFCLALTPVGAMQDTPETSITDPSKAKNWSAYEPTVVTLENGVRVQKVPDSNQPLKWFYNENWNYYNTYYLRAEQRGCTACHTLPDVLMAIGHCDYSGAYPTDTQELQTCIGCHTDTYSGMGLQQPIHSVHMSNKAFQSMGGNCESCHYIDRDGKFLRWDFVKYDVMQGITPMTASDLNITVDWNQDELTPIENIFTPTWSGKYLFGGDYELGYSFDYLDAYKSESVRDTYKVVFSGDIDRPCELSINEMIELFGTESSIFCNQCVINGIGGPLIFQTESKGISMAKILEYLKVQDPENSVIIPIGADGYSYGIMMETTIKEKGMLVFELNGEELTYGCGYPIWFMAHNITVGNKTRSVIEVAIVSREAAGDLLFESYGDFIDDATGYLISKPNIGVLNTPSGTIFAPGETVHLEGYASAYEEPIQKIEFSFDRGKTWHKVETKDTVSERWVYWKLNVKDLPEGSYVLWMRAYSLNDETGELRVNEEIPKFLVNVKQ